MSGWFAVDSPDRGHDDEETSPARELEEIGSVHGSPERFQQLPVDEAPRRPASSSGGLAGLKKYGGPPREASQSPSSSSADHGEASPRRTAWGAAHDFSDGDVSDADREGGGSTSTNDARTGGATRENYARVAGIDASLPVEEQLHLVWRRYSDHIYDFFAQHFLEYPSNTVAFVPQSRRRFNGADFAMHQMYLGTTSPNDDNSLLMYNIYTPAELEESDMEETESRVVGAYTDVANMVQQTLKVSHNGPVVRVRPCPTRPHLVCTRSTATPLSIYDLEALSMEMERRGAAKEETENDGEVDEDGRRQRRSSTAYRPNLSRPTPSNAVSCPPTVTLRGPQRAGIGLQWHPAEENILAVTSYDQKVYLYDLAATAALCQRTHNWARRGAQGRAHGGGLRRIMAPLP